MLRVGLDLSRRRVVVCLISSEGELVERFRVAADREGVYGLTRRVAVFDECVRGVVESMNGARFVHDELVGYGWEVLVADAQRVKGAGAVGVQDRQGGRPGAGGAVVSRSSAGDLGGEPRVARRA